MSKWFLPIRIILLFLIALSLLASFSWSEGEVSTRIVLLRNVAAIFLGQWIMAWGLEKLKLSTPSRWEHRVITGLILFLLFDDSLSWWVFPIVGAVTELLQRLIRIPGGPLFNPAALGALVMSIFGYYPSWWGTSFEPRLTLPALDQNGISIAAILTLIIAGYVAYKYKKLPVSLALIIGFSISYFFIIGFNPLFLILEGTLLFFALVMASEPKTSPNLPQEQYIFGALVGALIPIGIHFQFPEAFLGALLVGNLYTGRRFLKNLFQPSSAPTTSSATPA